MKLEEVDWERLFPEDVGVFDILDNPLDVFDEQELFQDWPDLMEEEVAVTSDDDQDWALHAALHDHPYAAKRPQDQTASTKDPLAEAEYQHQENPGPSYKQDAQYVELPNFTPPANAVPVMTCHGIPVYAAGWNAAPTFGEQKEKKVADKAYIKKPLNAFMRFLKQNRESAAVELGVRTSAVVNKYLGERWKSLSPEEKEPYEMEAKVESFLHHVAHDGWSHKINYGKKRKRSWTKVEITPASIRQ